MWKKLLTTVTVTALCTCNAYAQSFDASSNSIYQNNNVGYDFEQTAYHECINSLINESEFATIGCLNKEIKRQDDGMQSYFKELLKQEQYQKWNKSTTPNSGNMKDMVDQYIAFRDRFCSMYAIGMTNLFTNTERGRKECLVLLNHDILLYIQRFHQESLSDFSTPEDMESEEQANEEYNRSHL